MTTSKNRPAPSPVEPASSLLEALRGRLLQEPPDIRVHDDYDFMPELRSASFRAIKAAVLLPIVARAEPSLLFTRRTESLARETLEETGVGAGHVTVAGYLDRYLTGTGFDIQPVVGLLAQGFVLAPDPREVASVFEVPLAFLLDPANRRRETRRIGGRERRFYAFTYQQHEIWGATAAIIVDLAARLDGISLTHEDSGP